MVIRRGEIWWADLPEPTGSEPGIRRPILVVQADSFNISAIGTVVAAMITSNLRLAAASGNVLITPRQSGLKRESVVNVSQLIAVDKGNLTDCVRLLDSDAMTEVIEGVKLILDLT